MPDLTEGIHPYIIVIVSQHFLGRSIELMIALNRIVTRGGGGAANSEQLRFQHLHLDHARSNVYT